eukprot:scaffold38926_cov32-Tisochrysis_lutea.AAC.1
MPRTANSREFSFGSRVAMADASSAPDPPIDEESEEEEDEDDVKIVLHQPEDWEEEELAENMGEEGAEYGGGEEELLESVDDGVGVTAQGDEAGDEAAGMVGSGASRVQNSAAARAATSKAPSKMEAAGGGTMKEAKLAKAEASRAVAALKARLGPVALMPGGMQMDLDEIPENIDLDSIQDPGWKRPDADPTDYFNYGFNEVTWRLYCKRQKVCALMRCRATTSSQPLHPAPASLPPFPLRGAYCGCGSPTPCRRSSVPMLKQWPKLQHR